MYLNGRKRAIPVSVWINVFFGGFANQFGWIFFGFGMIFFWLFACNADMSFLLFSGERVTVQGVITESRETNASENEESIYENHYTFVDANGKRIQDFSYVTGKWLREGAEVTVEYPEGRPYYSRIQGMRRRMFGPAALLVLIFPLVGLVFLLFGLAKALRVAKLLQQGIPTKGKLLTKEATNTTINEQRVYKFTFAFQDRSGRRFEVVEKTHKVALLQDDREESLLYLQDNPEKAVLLDSLPGSPKIDRQGAVQSTPLGRAFLQLVFPVLVLAGHGAYIYFTFFR
ncbi:MAG: DUF3592 domain-containing protein [Candidatus Electrothrix sp. GW3-4]|uniref:DUF3592 domain-containing protein n=1 Tax=Candidatus Electrothrix sp. GW3-4 TaxID=3126740 RepID=UPI0030D5E6DC